MHSVPFNTQVYRGLISRMDDVYDVMIPVKEGQRLTVVVESQGRIGYGFLNDTKVSCCHDEHVPFVYTAVEVAKPSHILLEQ